MPTKIHAQSVKTKHSRKAPSSNSHATGRTKQVARGTVQAPLQPATSFSTSKHHRILALLVQSNGASIPELAEATGWQQHSLRGFLSGTVKKKLGMNLTSSKGEGEDRRYRVEAGAGN